MTDSRSLLQRGGVLLVAWIYVISVRDFAVTITHMPFSDWTSAQYFIVTSFCILAFLATVSSGMYFYMLTDYFEKRQSQKQLRLYPGIYRVTSSEAAVIVLLAPDATVLVGDFGWQAEPVQADAFIYLHGLNEDWSIVWYAGFAPSALELVGAKPENQYNRVEWQRNKSQCPFVVQSRVLNNKTFGLPKTMIGRWIQGVLIPVDKCQANR